ncbi:MAG: AAA family ATPase [Panacibacter sp.]
MKIKSLQLKNFKRFTDLTLKDIPENAKLVLLIGSNGSGKSSVFDGFERVAKEKKEGRIAQQYNKNQDYYSKEKGKGYTIVIDAFNNLIIKNDSLAEGNISFSNFYGRTSFRQIPRIERTGLGQRFNVELDTDRPLTFIDRDERFENDLEYLFGKLLKEFFRSNDDKSEIKESVIAPINSAFEKVFLKENGTKLELLELIPPLEGKVAEVNFKKGNSIFHYNQLSAGEKEIFNILINLVARKEYYTDTIYFFDEIDLHLNTKLQYTFLKEIVENWIPENCQLWTASHSLGFIDYANDYEKGCIIDFDDLDFDKPQVLSPKAKDNFEIFELAVSKTFIDKVVQGRKIIFSENTDTPLYNDLGIENVFFFVANDKIDVFQKAKNHNHYGLIDRDYLSDKEIEEIKGTYPFLYILPYYSIENLLYQTLNLEEYYGKAGKTFNKEEYTQAITTIKNTDRDYLAAGIVQARGGYPFYKENERSKNLKAFKENYRDVIDLLRSDDFETFYKIFPAKDFGKDLSQRQNLSKIEIAKTTWFKLQIEKLIK